MICDGHCHFLSAGLFHTLGVELGRPDEAETALPAALGWDVPGSPEALAARWVSELDRHAVDRAMLIASVAGDEASVAAAGRAQPSRVVGAFLFNPVAPDAPRRLEAAFDAGLQTVCLFPAMHHYRLDAESVEAVFAAAARRRRVVFVHCGMLSVGFRARLGLPSPFDLRLGDPLAVSALAVRYPSVPVLIPHFGAGLFRETLMAADQAPNIVLDSSSSNRWIRYHPGLTLRDVLARALDVVGPERIVFGSDSSFFPRGWHRAVYETQAAACAALGLDAAVQAAIFGGNFQRLFPGSL